MGASELAYGDRANALFNVDHDAPDFGHRFLVDVARDAYVTVAERTAWRTRRDNGWCLVFGKERDRGAERRPARTHAMASFFAC